MANRTFNDNARLALKPGRAQRANPTGICIKCILLVINCNVYVSDLEMQPIDRQVVKLGRVITNKGLDKLINRSDGPIARQLAINSKAQWDQMIPMITDVNQGGEVG